MPCHHGWHPTALHACTRPRSCQSRGVQIAAGCGFALRVHPGGLLRWLSDGLDASDPKPHSTSLRRRAVLKDILIPMAKCHADPERPSFTPLEVEAIAAHFGTVFFRHYHLYQFVLSQPRPKEEQYLEGFLETMHLPAFDGVALPGDMRLASCICMSGSARSLCVRRGQKVHLHATWRGVCHVEALCRGGVAPEAGCGPKAEGGRGADGGRSCTAGRGGGRGRAARAARGRGAATLTVRSPPLARGHLSGSRGSEAACRVHKQDRGL